MNTNELKSFLTKYETYLGKISQIITPDNWDYYKEHGSLPALPKDDELQAKLLTNGFDKKKILSDFSEGNLSKDDLYELFDHIFSKAELNYIADEQSEIALFGDQSTLQLNLAEAVIDYLDEKGLNT